MEISASRIFRVEPFQHRLCGDSPSADGGNVPRPAAGQEGRHQGFYPLNSHFLLFVSLAQIRDRRPLRKGERQSGYSCVYFVKYSQFTDSILLHRWFTLHRRDIPVSRNSFARCYGQFLRVAFINRLYRRVRRLGAPYLSGLYNLSRRDGQWPPAQRFTAA